MDDPILRRVSWLFELNQTLYWVALATWFGSSLFIAIAAPIILRTVRELDPTLPGVLSVNLDAQHSTLLAGTIVSQIMRVVTRVALGCAVAILIGLIGQTLIIQPWGTARVQLIIRAALFTAAVAVLLYDWRMVSPRLFFYRQQYIDEADNPDVANVAREQFERYSRESVNVLFFQTLLLLGMIVASVSITLPSIFGD